jgi:putative ABC transport system substrate-binding protein
VDRRAFVAGTFGLLAAPLGAHAQQQLAKVYRIGFLGSESVSNQANRVEALRAGLRDLGYVEGKNIGIEFRWGEGKYDRLPELAAELVRLKVDVIVTSGSKATVAAKRATTTIPIVLGSVGDAVATGLVTSLARPGGNITGWTFLGPELTAKRLELLKEAIPRISQVAFLENPADPTASRPAMEITAKALKLSVQPFEARAPGEFDSVFAAMARGRVDAVVVQGDTMFTVNAKTIADLAVKHRLPSAGLDGFAEAGGLIAYGANPLEGHRRAAVFVDKILKGANPGDLPIERATRFVLVINLKTAKALGLTIPPSLLARADEVIHP